MQQFVEEIATAWPDASRVPKGALLEAELSTKVYNMATFRQFIRTLETAAHQTVGTPQHLLTVSRGRVRLRLNDALAINQFISQREKAFPPGTVFERKTRVKLVQLDDGLRFRYSAETPATENDYTSQASNAVYRYATRYTLHVNERMRVDFTAVKESNGPTFHASGVMRKAEHYEVELEVTGVSTEAELRNVFRGNGVLEAYLRFFSGDLAISTEVQKSHLLKSFSALYLDRVPRTERHRALQDFSRLFPHIKALSRDALERERSSLVVTDKLDGERALLFVNPDGRFCVVQKDVHLKGTDGRGKKLYQPRLRLRPTEAVDTTVSNSLFDGELVYNAASDSYMFATFDAIFYKGTPVFKEPFMSKRYTYVRELCLDAPRLRIRAKRFVPLADLHKQLITPLRITVDAEARTMTRAWEEGGTVDVDGLVLQDAVAPYPFFEPQWEAYKWKPSFLTTVDFRVGGLVTADATVPSVDTVSNRRFRKCQMFVARADKDPIDGVVFLGEQRGAPRAEGDGHVIKNGMIVECRYSTVETTTVYGTPERLTAWIPIRVRTDKAVPNAMLTYTSTMEAIANPVTLADLNANHAKLRDFMQTVCGSYVETTVKRLTELSEAGTRTVVVDVSPAHERDDAAFATLDMDLRPSEYIDPYHPTYRVRLGLRMETVHYVVARSLRCDPLATFEVLLKNAHRLLVPYNGKFIGVCHTKELDLCTLRGTDIVERNGFHLNSFITAYDYAVQTGMTCTDIPASTWKTEGSKVQLFALDRLLGMSFDSDPVLSPPTSPGYRAMSPPTSPSYRAMSPPTSPSYRAMSPPTSPSYRAMSPPTSPGYTPSELPLPKPKPQIKLKPVIKKRLKPAIKRKHATN